MEIPSQIAAQQALLRQNVALSVIKQAADQQKALVSILDESIRTIAASQRGTNLNISV